MRPCRRRLAKGGSQYLVLARLLFFSFPFFLREKKKKKRDGTEKKNKENRQQRESICKRRTGAPIRDISHKDGLDDIVGKLEAGV